jgi:hypothetical protein
MIDWGLKAAAEHSLSRSSKWEKVKNDFLLKYPACVICGTTECCQVHHVIPFHVCVLLGYSEEELDERNLITLCETEKGEHEQNHHLAIGHFFDFRSSNLYVREDIITYHNLTEIQIKQSSQFLNEEKNKKMKEWKDMNEQDKQEIVKLINLWYPKI